MKWNFSYQITAVSRTRARGLPPPDPCPLCPLPSTEFVEPPPLPRTKFLGTPLVLMYHTIHYHPRRMWTWFSFPVSRSDVLWGAYSTLLPLWRFSKTLIFIYQVTKIHGPNDHNVCQFTCAAWTAFSVRSFQFVTWMSWENMIVHVWQNSRN